MKKNNEHLNLLFEHLKLLRINNSFIEIMNDNNIKTNQEKLEKMKKIGLEELEEYNQAILTVDDHLFYTKE